MYNNSSEIETEIMSRGYELSTPTRCKYYRRGARLFFTLHTRAAVEWLYKFRANFASTCYALSLVGPQLLAGGPSALFVFVMLNGK